MTFQAKLNGATRHLSQHDPRLATVINYAGPCKIEPHNDYFRSLASSIIGQQLSVKSAASIRSRFAAMGSGTFPTPEEVLRFKDEELRASGFSGAKVKYVKDLAQHVVDKRLDLDRLPELSNAEIITEVTDVKGIGDWTAHMFLMFCLGRLDVLPVGDLGVRKGMQMLYELKELPTPIEMMAVAEHNGWSGYETVASWYLWEVLDNSPT